MDKATAVQKVREVLGIEPSERDGAAEFELNGLYRCHVGGKGEQSMICFRNGGTNTDYF